MALDDLMYIAYAFKFNSFALVDLRDPPFSWKSVTNIANEM